MGGNALKEISTRRITAAEYHQQLVPDLLAKLRTVLGTERKIYVVEAYQEKPDFGDVDVLIESQKNLPVNWIEMTAKEFSSQQVVKNGAVTSLDFQSVQIDLIKCPSDEIEWTRKYFSFNDLGNLIGRVAHKMGFKFGHDGLTFVVRNPEKNEHVLREIMVSQDWDTVLEFLGFDAKTYHKGFKNKQEIFDFVVKSKYFQRDIYLLENRNHTSRVRDAKRQTYREFLTYCEDHPEITGHLFKEKKYYMLASFRVFPGFEKSYLTALKDLALTNESQNKYNGLLVSEWTGLKDRALGEKMAMVQRVIGEGNKQLFHQRVLVLSHEELQTLVKESSETAMQEQTKAFLKNYHLAYPLNPEHSSDKKRLFKIKN